MRNRDWACGLIVVGLLLLGAAHGVAGVPATASELRIAVTALPNASKSRIVWNNNFEYSATPGNPKNATANYAILQTKLFDPHPEFWANAHIDGDYLVINTTKRSITDAKKRVESLGLKQMNYRIRKVQHSEKDLKAAMRMVEQDNVLGSLWSTLGPSYADNGIVIGLNPDAMRYSETELFSRIDKVVPKGIPVQLFQSGWAQAD